MTTHPPPTKEIAALLLDCPLTDTQHEFVAECLLQSGQVTKFRQKHTLNKNDFVQLRIRTLAALQTYLRSVGVNSADDVTFD